MDNIKSENVNIEEQSGEGHRGLSLDEWVDQSREGKAIAALVYPRGVSMKPLIIQGKDSVLLGPITGGLLRGDIVLFRRHDGANVLHRVWKIRGDTITTFGDGCLKPDAPIDRKAVMAKALIVYKKGRTVRVDGAAARFQGRVWWVLYPLRWVYKTGRHTAGRILRKMPGIKPGK